RTIPSFTSIARLDIPFSSLIEVLPWLGRQKSGTAGRGIVSGGWKATPRHRKFLVPTCAGPRHRRASPAHPIRACLRSLSFEDTGHSPELGKIHQRSNWHCSSAHTVGNGVANCGVVGDCEKNGIGHSDGCPALAVRTVASCAVLSVEKIEVRNFVWRDHLRLLTGPTRRNTAAGAGQECD